jgi:hypothetical protein
LDPENGRLLKAIAARAGLGVGIAEELLVEVEE